MKALKRSLFLLLVCCLSACDLREIDNYEGPDATLHGAIYDNETGELIQQDIINGSVIEFTEHGFDNPQIQSMIFKPDGTYRNNLVFSGTYTIGPARGNFVPVEPQEVTIQGDALLNFQVQPYIRVKNVTIEKVDNKVVATFNLQQTIASNVRKIGLFAHPEPHVGEPVHTVSAQLDINGVTNEITVYRLEINLDAYGNELQAGKSYFFRAGALIDAPEAKFNYAPAVELTL